MPNHPPVVLIVLDGWGYRDSPQYNAIAAAHTPQWQQWWRTCPHQLLSASGESVGLPQGQMGNSEVGHMHIGAGRLVLQDLTYINHSIETGEFFENPVLLSLLNTTQHNQRAIHIMGLLSPGGVHSHQAHLFAFLELCARQQFDRVYLHLFLDGRDAAPKQALDNLQQLESVLQRFPVAKIASITGRYWAMDRDKRWERLEPVYILLTTGQSDRHFNTAAEAIRAYYAENLTDEFIPPTALSAMTPIASGDALFYFNFRADRAKQLTEAFLDPNFKAFPRAVVPQLSQFVTMTRYADHLPTHVVFPAQDLVDTLGEVLAQHGLRQLRIAETEKYAHVTFFLNGGIERPFNGEDRILIPSPKVKTYDRQPEMSAPELSTAIIKAIQSKQYDVIIANFANADMVGHTGDFKATVVAIEAIDRGLQAIGKAIQQAQGHLLITADHGNAECMFDDSSQQPHTAHTCEKVPLLYIGDPNRRFKEGSASLRDIAPTLLLLLGITPPPAMTGHILWA